jgi:Holliday junction resolvasome RuvABC endonuclease subunit
MILAGIDYSITSPAICILDTTTNKHHYYNLCSVNKALKNSTSKIIDLTPYPIWNTDMERYDLISEWALNVLKDNKVEMIAIEGYAMGARAGLVCNIAENGGILRFKLHKAGIPFTVYAPTQVKKFITTKGNAKKDEVIDCVEKETMISFADELGLKQYAKPADDLADSYAIVKLLERNMNAPDSK